MNTQEAYNHWAQQYDTNTNRTRDLEAKALSETLGNIRFTNCLEIGCGTGKNTAWFLEKAALITAVDLSEEMLAKARAKCSNSKVQFVQADITREWTFTQSTYNLVSYSLVLEHIENLQDVLQKTAAVLQPGGYVYIGELHPFKQYTGSKARFDTEAGTQVVDCYNHHVTDFVMAAKNSGLQLMDINEYFYEDNRTSIPRILTLLFKS